MAQYKVLQDIEAEDKLLGPLSLRQFIYAVIVVVMGFVAFRLATVQIFLAIPFLPPIIFFGLLAAPIGQQQSSEVWLLAKIKYFIFPRRRIWDQEGIQDLVTITAPKAIVAPAMKDFGKEEAQSRLKALATTMDTRGWAVKNLNTQGYVSPMAGPQSSDRLLELQPVGAPEEALAGVKPSEDVLDSGNPLSQAMNSMVAQNQQTHRQAILQKMQTIAASQQSQTQTPAVVAPSPQPVPNPIQPAKPAQTAVTQAQAPAIINEVKSPPVPAELPISTPKDAGDDSSEVVVSLH